MKKIIASRVIVAGLNGVQQPVLADGHSPRLLASPPYAYFYLGRT